MIGKDWQQTIIIAVLVIGAVVAGALHLEALSGTLAGAAAGLILPGGTSTLAKAAPLALALLGGAVFWGCTPMQSPRGLDFVERLTHPAASYERLAPDAGAPTAPVETRKE